MEITFDNESRQGKFFCIDLVWFVMDNNADYKEEFEKARNGNCSYINICPRYKRTMKKYGSRQLNIDLNK